jgi:very-short-patch-repair endonuclease
MNSRQSGRESCAEFKRLRKLWFYIRNRQVDGYKFVRQTPVAGYFADFLCRELNLVLEIDGATHSTDMELAPNAKRTEILRAEWYEVMRILNDDVHNGLDGVIDAIHFAMRSRSTS